MHLSLPERRGASQTIYGALGECIPDKFYYEQWPSTNSAEVTEFMTSLGKLIRDDFKARGVRYKRPWLVLDNHSVSIQGTRSIKGSMSRVRSKFRPRWVLGFPVQELSK